MTPVPTVRSGLYYVDNWSVEETPYPEEPIDRPLAPVAPVQNADFAHGVDAMARGKPVMSAERVGERFLRRYTNAGTRSEYRRDLETFFSYIRQQGVDPLAAGIEHLEDYLNWLQTDRGLAPATVARRISTVSGFYKQAVKEELLHRSPAANLEAPKVRASRRRTGLTREELNLLLEVAERHSARAHCLIALLALDGLRVSSAIGLDVEDVGHQRGHRVVHVKTKGGGWLTCPLAPSVAAALDRCLAGRTTGPVFTTRTGSRMTRKNAADLIARVVREALPHLAGKITPHSLRRTFVTLSLDSGASLRSTQDAAGHASADTTRLYDLERHRLDDHPTFGLVAWLGDHPMR